MNNKSNDSCRKFSTLPKNMMTGKKTLLPCCNEVWVLAKPASFHLSYLGVSVHGCKLLLLTDGNDKDSKISQQSLASVWVQTLSERLWTSAARDLFADVEPRDCFFASADSNSTSFTQKKNEIPIISWEKQYRESKELLCSKHEE